MKHLREKDLKARQGSGGAGHAITHVIAPWTVGSESLFIAATEIQPGSSTAMTELPGVESTHLTLAGEGLEIVGDQEVTTSQGSYVFIPRGAPHRVINRGDVPLRIISISAPPPLPPSDVAGS